VASFDVSTLLPLEAKEIMVVVERGTAIMLLVPQCVCFSFELMIFLILMLMLMVVSVTKVGAHCAARKIIFQKKSWDGVREPARSHRSNEIK
jgi:hypothetical protein